MRLLMFLFGSAFALIFAASHSTPAPASPPAASLTMPKSEELTVVPDAPMDADAGERTPAVVEKTWREDQRDWLNDHTAQANVLYACGIISQGEYSADRVADGIRRTNMRAASPADLARDREFVAAEMLVFRQHSCNELAAMPFARSWSALR